MAMHLCDIDFNASVLEILNCEKTKNDYTSQETETDYNIKRFGSYTATILSEYEQKTKRDNGI